MTVVRLKQIDTFKLNRIVTCIYHMHATIFDSRMTFLRAFTLLELSKNIEHRPQL